MKVAVVLDEGWLRQEAPALRRLAVGLVGETVGVTQVCPAWWAATDAAQDLPITGRYLTYGESRINWVTEYRIGRLAGALTDEGIDVVHVLDGALQRGAAKLAARLNAALLVEVWSAEQAEQAGRGIGPEGTGCTGVVHAAATEPLAARCRAMLGRDGRVVTIRPGVYRSDEGIGGPPLADVDRSLGCVVVGDGRLDEHYRALIDGLSRLAPEMPQAMFFFYNTGFETHRLWQAVEQAGLSGRATFVPFEPTSRHLMLQADLIIQPQPLGRVRTLVLDAMAEGRVVLAAEDRLLDYLIHDKTAEVISEVSAEVWVERVRSIVRDPQPWVELGRSAREYVHAGHTASGYVGRILELYEQLAAPQTLAFGANADAAKG